MIQIHGWPVDFSKCHTIIVELKNRPLHYQTHPKISSFHFQTISSKYSKVFYRFSLKNYTNEQINVHDSLESWCKCLCICMAHTVCIFLPLQRNLFHRNKSSAFSFVHLLFAIVSWCICALFAFFFSFSLEFFISETRRKFIGICVGKKKSNAIRMIIFTYLLHPDFNAPRMVFFFFFFSKNICTRSKQYAFVLVSQQSFVQRTKRTMPNSISKRIESKEIDTKCIYGVEDERNDMMAFYLLSECRCMFMYTVTFPYASAIAIICLVSHFYIEKNRKRSSDERKKTEKERHEQYKNSSKLCGKKCNTGENEKWSL